MVYESGSEGNRIRKAKDNLTHRSKSLSVDVDNIDIAAQHLLKEPHGQVNPLPKMALSNPETLSRSALVDTDTARDKRTLAEESERDTPTSALYYAPYPGITRRSIGARNRWRSLKHTMTFAKHLASSSYSASRYVEGENKVDDLLQPQFFPKKDEGVGAAVFGGTNAASRCSVKGRKGSESLLVRQEKSIITFLRDFYVACLKMHTGHFLLGAFVTPVLLGLFFTPFYIFGLGGLTFDKELSDNKLICPWSLTREKCSQYLNIFLYA